MVDVSISAYFAGAFVLLAWMALLDRHSLRVAFWLSLLWPATLLLIFIVALFEQFDWHVEIMRHHRPGRSVFGFRRRPGSGVGWAVRCLWFELQVWHNKQELE